MKFFVLAIASLFLLSCQSAAPSKDYKYKDLSMVEGLLSDPGWSGLKRFPPAYPMDDALAGNEGCATIEYVITPDYEIEDIRVVEATGDDFAAEAKKNVKKWRWSELPDGKLEEPVKTQTRFEFCLAEAAGDCAPDKLAATSQCSGQDVISSVGTRLN